MEHNTPPEGMISNGEIRPYRSKSGTWQYKPNLQFLSDLDATGEGFCLACAESSPCESDARKSICPACEQPKLYGALELLLLNLYW